MATARKTTRRAANLNAGKPAKGRSLDPVTLEVIRNALPAVANEMAAGENAAWQGKGSAQADQWRHIFERTHVDEAEFKSSFGDEPRLHAARCADKQQMRGVARDKFAGHGQRRDDVAAGAATGDENAQLGQERPFG